MDAVKFVKEFYRMVDYHTCCCIKCTECEIYKRLKSEGFIQCREYFEEYPERVVEVVEQWSKEHPVKTNTQKFEEVFGFIPDKISCVMPRNKCVDYCSGIHECGSCSERDWWDKLYVEPDKENK